MPAYAITPGRPADVPRLVEVWEASVRPTHLFLSDDDVAFFRPLVLGALGTTPLACVRDASGVPVGFAGVEGEKLEMLFVDPAWHGRGVGRALLAHAVDRMGARWVDVNEQNARGVAFYLGIGAQVIGRSERDGLGKPFPLLHLRLPLAE